MQKGKMKTESEFYKKLLSYDQKVLSSFLRKMNKMSWKKLSKNMEASHYSIAEIFVHVLGVYNGWLNYNLYGKWDEIPTKTLNMENYHSTKDIQKFMDAVWDGVSKLAKNLDDELLDKKVRAPWMPGNHSLRDVLMQVSLEQAHHIGEIICLMWQLDVEPPEMTWIMNTRNLK